MMSSSNLPPHFKANCFKIFFLKNKDLDYSNMFLEAIKHVAVKLTASAMTKFIENESGIYLLAMDSDGEHIQGFHHTSSIPGMLCNNNKSKLVALAGVGSTATPLQIIRDLIIANNRVVPNWSHLWESSNTTKSFDYGCHSV